MTTATKPTRMEPEHAIDTVADLAGQVARMSSFLRAETEDIADAWEGLRIAGGQRADHAALLLGRLRPHLRDLAAFCKNVETQIDTMVADPFGRNA
jgi:ABC-type transporter Mla subunit MlaD